MVTMRFLVVVEVEQEHRPPVDVILKCIRQAVGEELGLHVSVEHVDSKSSDDTTH